LAKPAIQRADAREREVGFRRGLSSCSCDLRWIEIWAAIGDRPKTLTKTRGGATGEGDQIINLKHELAQLGGKIDWDWIDREIAPLDSEKGPGIESRFVTGLLPDRFKRSRYAGAF